MRKRIFIGLIVLLLISSIALAEPKVTLAPNVNIEPGATFNLSAGEHDPLGLSIALSSSLIENGFQVSTEEANYGIMFTYTYHSSYGQSLITKAQIVIIDWNKKVVATIDYSNWMGVSADKAANSIIKSLLKKLGYND